MSSRLVAELPGAGVTTPAENLQPSPGGVPSQDRVTGLWKPATGTTPHVVVAVGVPRDDERLADAHVTLKSGGWDRGAETFTESPTTRFVAAVLALTSKGYRPGAVPPAPTDKLDVTVDAPELDATVSGLNAHARPGPGVEHASR